jgi:transposase
MNHLRSTHLRGERGQAFADLIRNVPPEQLLCVSIDISKYFHVAMVHNGLGEIVTPPFEVDIYQSGFDHLCQKIDAAKLTSQAKLVLVGMEPTGHYFENLARHLLDRSQPVRLINSFSVKKNREQQLMRREKTDQIDVAAIGDLLRRGEGSLYRPPSSVYLQLQQIDRVRIGKLKIESMLKNQILGHLDRIFPGLVLIGETAQERYVSFFNVDPWQCHTLQDLIRICPNPHTLAKMPPGQLIELFHAQKCRLGPSTATKIIAQAQKTLLPDPELAAIRCELLQHDLALLETVQAHIALLEQRLITLLAQTPYAIWTQFKGISAVQAASLAAAIGDPVHYSEAAQVFRRSGLVSGRNDSGTQQRKGRGNPILKIGDVYLRRSLMNAVSTLLVHQPALYAYYKRLSLSKPAGVARVATARKAIGLLWAAQRDQSSNTLILCKGAAMR